MVNIGSIVGNNGFNELSGYTSSKTALIGLTKSFAVEMASLNIRANIISPGFIKTSYFDKFKKRENYIIGLYQEYLKINGVKQKMLVTWFVFYCLTSLDILLVQA